MPFRLDTPAGLEALGLNVRTPRVSIGLPVYNGEAFLADAVDSLLGQSFADFELIISDNASTDATESLCRERASRDHRIRYYRNPANIGAMRNFNRVFELSSGEYFKWAAHDDVHEPEYLARGVGVLDTNPDIVLVCPQSRDIDEHGNTLKIASFGIDMDSPRVHVRFRELIRREHSCVAVFGLVRAHILRGTRLLGDYADCDRVLLAEIGLAGRMREIAEPLFVHRMHKNRSVWQYKSRQTRSAWFDPSKAGRPVFPYCRQYAAYMSAIARAPLSASERVACAAQMPRWLAHNADGIWEDVTFAARYTLRPIKRRLIPSSKSASEPNGSNG